MLPVRKSMINIESFLVWIILLSLMFENKVISCVFEMYLMLVTFVVAFCELNTRILNEVDCLFCVIGSLQRWLTVLCDVKICLYKCLIIIRIENLSK